MPADFFERLESDNAKAFRETSAINPRARILGASAASACDYHIAIVRESDVGDSLDPVSRAPEAEIVALSKEQAARIGRALLEFAQT